MKEIASEKKAHAKLSASGSERWLECPGSVSLCESAPPQRESEYATEGTDAHSCLEVILKNHKGKPYSAARMLKGKYPDVMIEHALKAYKEIEARIPEGADLLCETKVDLTFVGPDMFGTVDAAIVEHFGRLWVIDYKYGAGVAVDPEDNTQLLYYALGLAYKYDFNFTEICLMIIQPRAPHERGPIREWVISVEELMSWTQKFKDGVERCEDPLAEFNPSLEQGGGYCRWCPAAPICPAIGDRALRQAQIDFNDDGAITALPAVPSIQIPNLSTILTACGKLETWIDKVRDHALHALERGEIIPGWKLVEKRSIRKWTDRETAEKAAKKTFGQAAFTEPELLSPAQLEKALPNAKDLVGKFITKNASDKSSGVTLVPESDKRPSVNQIEADFTEVEESGEIAAIETTTRVGQVSKTVRTEFRKGEEVAKKATTKKLTKKPVKKAVKSKTKRK